QLAAMNPGTDIALARMLLGTTGAAYAYHLAGSGIISGARLGPRNTQSLDGVPPHSVNIGGKWIQYNNLEPFGTWLAVGADLYEAFARHYDPADDAMTTQIGTFARAAVQ